MASWPDYLIVADPASLRLRHYLADLRSFVSAFDPRPKIHVVCWSDLIAANGDLSDWLPDGSLLMRVESPGRNADVFRSLLRCAQRTLNEPETDYQPDPGWIQSPHRLHIGMCQVLSNLASCVKDHSRCWPSSSLEDTLRLFDKNEVSRLLTKHGILTPEWFQPERADEVYAGIEQRHWDSAYLKLAFGSCASGIARIERSHDRTFRAVTTIKRIGDRFYNSYQMQVVEGDRLGEIIRFVVSDTATVQQAVSKTRLHGDEFDARVVVVNGEIIATVFRASPQPMTNLHLGGYRADADACLRTVSERAWSDAWENCRGAAALFDLAALGIDLAMDRKTGEPRILEVNSFGDFLPNWHDHRGRTVHQLEIEATARRFARENSV